MHAKLTRDRKKLFTSELQQLISSLERQNAITRNRLKHTAAGRPFPSINTATATSIATTTSESTRSSGSSCNNGSSNRAVGNRYDESCVSSPSSSPVHPFSGQSSRAHSPATAEE